ncbi:hypothetical protein PAXINDRAFT_7008 [Paxillus involutus ATCC 200175]|nr:hypothetical protein PAXINDRAFT_7008 [Paxillus involutus ATCC 200175]
MSLATTNTLLLKSSISRVPLRLRNGRSVVALARRAAISQTLPCVGYAPRPLDARGYASQPPGGGGGAGFPFMMQQPREKGEALKEYSVDLTEMARNGKLDPTIGRDEEIRRTIQILSRRTKSNPVLIGPPGVGKTAILEGLASRIVAKEVPEVNHIYHLLIPAVLILV